MSNATFRPDYNNSRFNASVGTNGIISYITYATGFSKAANLLLDQVLKNNADDIDLLIYPICFNMRHSIELRLKGVIEELSKLANIRNVKMPEFNLATSHYIANIWSYYKNQSEILDIRYATINILLEPTILDIAEIDSTGQTFRYPFDNNKEQKHLTELDNISCITLKSKFVDIEENLEDLYFLSNLLIEEYSKGTFTKKLSRVEIFNLAKELPLRDKWACDLKKDYLKQQFSLSSNDLSKALDLIQNHYETCAIIGINKPLISLTDDLLFEICEIWAIKIYPGFKKLYSNNTNNNHYNYEIDDILDRIQQESYSLMDIYNDLENRLTIEQLADLYSLFYLSARSENKVYSENYISLFNEHHQHLSRVKVSYRTLDQIFEKTNFLNSIVISLLFLYQTDIAEKIIQKFNLEKYFSDIPAARDRTLFKKWKYLGYED